ncbi:MAG: cell division protein ZapB [Spirochaetia bacterium]
MITLEQIRLLESKITRAIDLIRVLKEENSTLRRGLESAQKRMRELETLVDGFKTDQKEIESVIVRTLHNLDELEESAAAAATDATVSRGEGGIRPGGISAANEVRPGGMPGAAAAEGGSRSPAGAKRAEGRIGAAAPPLPRTASETQRGTADETTSGGTAAVPPGAAGTGKAAETLPPKEELDIF